MTKRLVDYTKDVIHHLFKDGAWMYPRERERVRDLTHLLAVLESRGIKCMLIELPAFLKHFDQCLDKGSYTNPNLCLSRPKREGEVIPRFLREIFLRIFEAEGSLVDDPCPDAVLFIRTLMGGFKKIRLECDKETTQNEVLHFFNVDASLPSPSLRWDLDELDVVRSERSCGMARSLHFRDLTPRGLPLFGDVERQPPEWADLVQRCFDIVASQYGLSPHLCGAEVRPESRPRNGPGVVAEVSKRSSKYELPNWTAKLQRCFPRDYYALPSFGWGFSRDRRSDSEIHGLNHEPPSRMIAVPKTLKAPRLIAAEPTSHMWIQQFLWQELEARTSRNVLRHCIRFRDQSRNGSFAKLGSKDGYYATIDLSEASDRVSLALIERFWRANPTWLESLHACRTRWLSYRDKELSIQTRLKKFSPMGSAVTFPLQSIVFATFALAAECFTLKREPSVRTLGKVARSISVFGDDIIIPRRSLEVLIKMLEFASLKVNYTKTFSGKNFRESCGVDAFRGWDVTPPKLLEIPTGSPGQVSSLVETSNNFHQKGFWYTAEYILKQAGPLAKSIVISNVPVHSPTIFSYTGETKEHLKKRWNQDYQRFEYRSLRVRTKTFGGSMSASARLLQYFTERPDPHTKWESGFVQSKLMKYQLGWG